jgi:hypothetical protein
VRLAAAPPDTAVEKVCNKYNKTAASVNNFFREPPLRTLILDSDKPVTLSEAFFICSLRVWK